MRKQWKRTTTEAMLDLETVASLLRPAIGDASVEAAFPISGGLANTNIRAVLSGRQRQVVLRLYQRDSAQAAKEHTLSGLLARRGVPVAAFLHFAETNPVTGAPYAVLEWIDGVQLESAAEAAGAAQLSELAKALGPVLAMIHEIGFDRPGFIDARLQVQQPIELGSAGLTKYLRRCLLEGPGGARLGESLATELLAYASTCGDDLAEWERRICLVHGDFNGSNILVRPGPRDSWEVAAVLDWEFAFSGAPAFDFGNLLRAPLGNHPVFETTVAETYRASGGRLPSNWRALSRIADLYAWADFVSRPAVDPSLVADARRVIQATLSKAG